MQPIDDIRNTLRRVRRNPGFALGVVLTVALGIGASTAMMSVIDAVLLRPLPYESAEDLMILRSTSPDHGAQPVGPSVPDYLDWRERTRSFSGLAATVTVPYNLPLGNRAHPLWANFVSADFFNVMGGEPALGRVFSHEEERPGEDLHTVVLSHRLWANQFAGDSAILGRTVLLDTTPYTVVGVMPPDFTFAYGFARNADAWAPLESWFARYGETMRGTDRRGRAYYQVLARLAPGVEVAEAERDLAAAARTLATDYPDSNRDVGAVVTPLRELEVGGLRAFLVPLFGATALVLLLACANAANLVLARSIALAKEVAIRKSIGAGSWPVVRALLMECCLLSVTGAGVGIALGALAVGAMSSFVPVELPAWMEFAVGPRTMIVALLAGVVVGLGVALVPAIQGMRIDLARTLRSGGRGGTGTHTAQRVRSGLVVAQVALSVILLVGAGLLVKSIFALSRVDAGLDTERLYAAHVSPPGDKYRGSERLPPYAALYTSVLERMRTLPGVVAVGGSNVIPNDGEEEFSTGSVLEREGDTPEMLRTMPPVRVVRTTPNYFDVAGIPLVAGRHLRDTDLLGGERVSLVSQETARRLWPGESPLGKRWRVPTPDGSARWLTVVGVVGDVRLAGVDRAPPLTAFVSYNQIAAGTFNFVVRAREDSPDLVEALRQAVWGIDPQVAVYSVRRIDDIVDSSYWRHRLWGGVLAVFALLALALASVGIYGVITQIVGERRREIGVRMALGARPALVVAWVERQVLLLVVAGIAIGVAASLGFVRSIRSLLFEVAPSDPVILLGVPLLLLATATVAALRPAVSAARVDPSMALQEDG